MECSEEDIYTIAGYGFDWRCAGRRLLNDKKVRDIGHEGGSEREKRDKVLLEWKSTKSRDATYQALVKVLRAIENNATADRVEELEKNRSKGTINDFLTLHLHKQYSFHLIIPPIRNCILYLGSLYQWAIMHAVYHKRSRVMQTTWRLCTKRSK